MPLLQAQQVTNQRKSTTGVKRQATKHNGRGTKATTDTDDTSNAINKTKGDRRNKSNACDSNKARGRAQVMPCELCT